MNILECTSKLKKNGATIGGDKKINLNGKKFGLRMWSMIDYLCNYEGYWWIKH